MVRPWLARDWELVILSKSRYTVEKEEHDD
jgi:hypothetical protein